MHASFIRVWDPGIRIFHWALVGSFSLAWLSPSVEPDLHVVAGYTLLGLIAFRTVWGGIGSRHARFADFVHSPSRIVHYLRAVLGGNAERYLGHNPAGGAMVLTLLLSLAVLALTGVAVLGAFEAAGPLRFLFNAMGDDGAHLLRWLHELFVDVVIGLIALHLLGVFGTSIQHGENLLRAMITGNKPRRL